VCVAARHLELRNLPAVVLGGTGPVGQRAVRLLARQGAEVRVGSRQLARAANVCETVRAKVPGARVEPAATATADDLRAALQGRILVIAAGAAGAVLLPSSVRTAFPDLRLAIDLNAVPPPGIEGVAVTDKAVERDGMLCYGAVGVGDTKMKTHKKAVARLFEGNDQVLDAEEVYALTSTIG
jgi:NAD(P)-dependent dehydrogenase (short-subunit alcohol dehydrogenase family)